MQHRFYKLSKKEKNQFQIKIILLCALILVPIFFLSYFFKIYFLVPIVIWIIISIIASFFDVPSGIKSGKLKYQSCLLISEEENDNMILVHAGTLFDYFFILEKNASVSQRKKMILSEYLRGLLELIYSNQGSLNTEIKGTTYILNERTATKIGFKVQRTDSIQKIILLLNYPGLLASKSFVSKKLSFPNLKQIKTYKSDINTLAKNKEKMEKMYDRLISTIANGN